MCRVLWPDSNHSSAPFAVWRGKMKIDLKALGLSEESTFEDIQAKLNKNEYFTQQDLDTEKNAAAAGARSAAESKYKSKLAKAGKLSDEDQKILDAAKRTNKLSELRKNETLAKLNDSDFELIVDANGLTQDMEDDAFNAKIKDISTKYKDRFTNGLPPITEKTGGNGESAAKATETYRPGDLGIFAKKA